MKNYADLGGCYPPQPSASADNTLLDLHNSSYHTQPHPIIAKYYPELAINANEKTKLYRALMMIFGKYLMKIIKSLRLL